MSLSYLETSLDRIDAAARDDVIEICINPDGTCWGEFQGDHFMRALDQRLTGVQVRDLGNQIASSANTTMSKDRPIVSVSITYKGRPIRAQVITPPAVLSAMSISLRFFSSRPLEGIALDFLYGKERKLEDLRVEKKRALRAVVAAAQDRHQLGQRGTLVFVDEVHRFNKSQQDAFLPHVEDGTLIFIGATTENPSFELNNALLSRARVYVLKSFHFLNCYKMHRKLEKPCTNRHLRCKNYKKNCLC